MNKKNCQIALAVFRFLRGRERIRTAVGAFAELCLATRPPDQGEFCDGAWKANRANAFQRYRSNALIGPQVRQERGYNPHQQAVPARTRITIAPKQPPRLLLLRCKCLQRRFGRFPDAKRCTK